MSDGLDDRYVSRREANEIQRETDASIASLRERQASMETRLVHEIGAVHSSVRAVESKLDRALASPPVDHGSLAAQRALDMLEKRAAGSSYGPLLYMIAGVVMLGVGALAVRFL